MAINNEDPSENTHQIDPRTKRKLRHVKEITNLLLIQSVTLIDAEYGRDYAKKNPALVKAVIETQRDLFLKFS